jgi:hypothetical protein
LWTSLHIFHLINFEIKLALDAKNPFHKSC